MNQTWPAIIVGGLLLLFAGFVAGSEWLAYGQLCASLKPDDPERRHSRRRFRRRMQVAIMIGLVGIALPVGDQLLEQNRNPLAFAIFCLVILGMAGWIGLLGVADLVSTRLHTHLSAKRLARDREEIEAELARFRERNTSRRFEQN